ncbi:MAG: NUDIX hydrolase [Tissierellales bacterium]|jgi:ADP-ribose pyrophosphatase|nr:NUDIX hydrolase [Tissierellales bacterium]
MSEKLKIQAIRPIKSLRYLNSFEIEYETIGGKKKTWELVSRQGVNRLENEIKKHQSYTDGAMMFAMNDSKDKIVMLKEYRVSAGRHIYMFPAGLIDEGESIKEASIREFKEETGMQFFPEYVEKERYVSVGIVNERVNIVYGKYSGEPSKENQEDSEDAEILLIDSKEAKRILEEEEVSIRSAMLLQNFFKIHPFFDE